MTVPVDGNALAGPLTEVFVGEVVDAVGRCAGCRTESAMAALVVFGPEPGWVARCPECESVVLRLVRTPDAVWLDLQGCAALRLPLGS